MGDGAVKKDSPWQLDAGVGFDVAGANEYRFDGPNPSLAPLDYSQVGLPLPDAHLGVVYEIPLDRVLGGSKIRFGGGLYGDWQRVRSNSDYDPKDYGSCDTETDPTCVEEENDEVEKNTATVWRDGLYLSGEFSRPVTLGPVEFDLGLRVTERIGLMTWHNSVGEFYAGGIMPHNENEEHAVIVDNQTRIGAVLGFVEAGVTIDGGANSPLNSDIGYQDVEGAAFVSSGYPTTLEQTAGQVGAYVEIDVGRLVMSAVKKKD